MKIPNPLIKAETALVIIDMQNDYCMPNGFLAKSLGWDVSATLQMISRLQNVLGKARSEGLLRIFVKTIHSNYTASRTYKDRMGVSPDFCLPNSWGSQIVSELTPEQDEIVAIKHRYSAFVDSHFPLIVRSNGIRNLLFAGTTTNVCVESTVRDAIMNDYLPIVLSDCVMSPEKDLHEASLRNISKYFGVVSPSEAVFALLK
ncbi:MAG: cysteine hydrolase [Nitrososphaerota archaeon]|nr:cysteine hydrolase [Nitrososphaerota archaeon]